MKRLLLRLSLALLALLTVFTAVSCGGSEDGADTSADTTTPPADTTTSAPTLDEVEKGSISKEALAGYTIVYNIRNADESNAPVVALRNAVIESTGVTLAVDNDMTAHDLEIVLGVTEQRAASVSLSEGLLADDVCIALQDSTVYILAGNIDALTDAVTFFVQSCLTEEGLSVPVGDGFVEKYDYPFAGVPTFCGVPLTDFVIAYDDRAVLDAANEASAVIRRYCGIIPEVMTASKAASQPHRIVISAFEVNASLRGKDVAATVVGGDIVLQFGIYTDLAAAVDGFASILENSNGAIAETALCAAEYANDAFLLNGKSIGEYTIVAAEGEEALAKNLRDVVAELSGYVLTVSYDGSAVSGPKLVLDTAATPSVTACQISASGEDVIIGGYRTAGTYFSVLGFRNAANENAADKTIDMTVDSTISFTSASVTEKQYSMFDFFNEDGTLNTASKKDLVVGFIGGSLTQAGTNKNSGAWINKTVAYLQETFPDRAVAAVNAGIGGTGSQFGAMRFDNNILQHEPDIVFIEFAVNDGAFKDDASEETKMKQAVYMEAMVRQCLDAEKVPVIIFLYTGRPVDEGTSDYNSWKNGVLLKEELAQNYSIPSINIRDYFTECYEEERKSDSSLTYMKYLGRFYYPEGDGYNVHPAAQGYIMFYNAIKDRMDKAGIASFLNANHYGAELFCTGYEGVISADYVFTEATNDRFTFSEGGWKHEDYTYSSGANFNMNYFEQYGLMSSNNAGEASFSFTTKADSISFYYTTSTVGNSASVYVDGEKVGSFSEDFKAEKYIFTTASFSLPGDGEEHTVEIRLDAPTNETKYFNFAYLIELFEN